MFSFLWSLARNSVSGIGILEKRNDAYVLLAPLVLFYEYWLFCSFLLRYFLILKKTSRIRVSHFEKPFFRTCSGRCETCEVFIGVTLRVFVFVWICSSNLSGVCYCFLREVLLFVFPTFVRCALNRSAVQYFYVLDGLVISGNQFHIVWWDE